MFPVKLRVQVLGLFVELLRNLRHVIDVLVLEDLHFLVQFLQLDELLLHVAHLLSSLGHVLPHLVYLVLLVLQHAHQVVVALPYLLHHFLRLLDHLLLVLRQIVVFPRNSIHL